MKESIAKLYCKCIKNKDKRKFIYNILIGKNKIAHYKYEEPKPKQTGYDIKGENNQIIIVENGIERPIGINEEISGLEIKINGNNNLVKLELPIIACNSLIEIGHSDNVHVEIGTTTKFFSVCIHCFLGNSQICTIGKNTTISGAAIHLDEQSSCIIGEDCKLSNSIRIWATDGHAILDNDTGKILNTATEPIVIGNHVWIGEGARITKNARIGNNCIVGGGTVACKDYKEDNVIIAGNPGKIIKRGITWDRKNPYRLQLEQDGEESK